MIKTKKGKVVLKGHTTEMLADFNMVAGSVIEMLVECGREQSEAVDCLKEGVELSTLRGEELRKEVIRREEERANKESEFEHE